MRRPQSGGDSDPIQTDDVQNLAHYQIAKPQLLSELALSGLSVWLSVPCGNHSLSASVIEIPLGAVAVSGLVACSIYGNFEICPSS